MIAAGLGALDPARRPLLLAPTSPRGWFGGQTVLALDAESDSEHPRAEGLEAAGEALDVALAGDVPLTAVVLGYEGEARVLTYGGGLAYSGDEWLPFGPRPPAAPARSEDLPDAPGPLILEPESDMDETAYVAGVEEVRRAVERGEVYVLNLTYRMRGVAAMGSWPVFVEMMRRGGGDMSAALLVPGGGWLSVSPERFLGRADRDIRVEPIKGTAPRGRDQTADEALAAAIAADEKETAEHVMIVDMERNDLGRVCEPGTVRVDPLREVIATPYCHQVVSVVHGTLRADVGMAEVLRATFPCGSVTGAPKVSAMRHIEQLERSPRGAYCGSLLVAQEGRLDSSVLIRTAELDQDRLVYGTGGGITWDSDPHTEWTETRVKAIPML